MIQWKSILSETHLLLKLKLQYKGMLTDLKITFTVEYRSKFWTYDRKPFKQSWEEKHTSCLSAAVYSTMGLL